MNLDPRTVLLAYSAVSALLSFALLTAGFSQRRFRGPAWWGAGCLLNGVGVFLLALRGTVPDEISVLLANGLIYLAISAMVWGLALYAGRAFQPWHHLAGIALCMLGLAWFLYGNPNTAARIAISSFGLAAQVGHAVLFCFYAWRLVRHWSHLLTLALFVGGVPVLLARGVGAIVVGDVPSLMAPGPLTSASFYTSMVFYSAGAIGFLSMMSARLGVELSESLRRREQEALYDPLTDILNRRGMEVEADRLFAWAQRHDRRLAVLLIDIDHFKQVNDTFGHAVGDVALRTLARCLQDHLRPEDRLARIGGEEFLILLPETTLDGALVLGERLRQAVAKSDIPAVAARVRVTASFGAAERNRGDAVLDDMLARADAALYQAKARGRNRVEGAAELPGAVALNG